MTKRVKITDVADVRPGDRVKMRYDGHTWRGKAWEDSGMLVVGLSVVRYVNGDAGAPFVSATRKVPKPRPLPTTPGTVLIATVRGVEGVQVMRASIFFNDRWISAKTACCAYWHIDADITDWEIVYAPGESK